MSEICNLDIELQTFKKTLKTLTKTCKCGKETETRFLEELKKENNYLREENLSILKKMIEKSENLENGLFGVKEIFLKIGDFGDFKQSYISIINDLNKNLKNQEKENENLTKKSSSLEKENLDLVKSLEILKKKFMENFESFKNQILKINDNSKIFEFRKNIDNLENELNLKNEKFENFKKEKNSEIENLKIEKNQKIEKIIKENNEKFEKFKIEKEKNFEKLKKEKNSEIENLTNKIEQIQIEIDLIKIEYKNVINENFEKKEENEKEKKKIKKGKKKNKKRRRNNSSDDEFQEMKKYL